MSETAPEPQTEGGGGGNILTAKYFGLPGFVWLGGAAILAYFLFFRNKSSASTSGTTSGGTSGSGSGSETGGNITVNVPKNRSQPVNAASGSTSPNGANTPGQGGQTGTPNPQPTPTPAPSTGSSTTTTTTPATNNVTVPNVVGQRLATATGILTAAGLREGGASQISGISQTVISQDPAANTSVAAGSMVTLRTSSS